MIPLYFCIKSFTNYILHIHFLLVFANLKMRQFPLNFFRWVFCLLAKKYLNLQCVLNDKKALQGCNLITIKTPITKTTTTYLFRWFFFILFLILFLPKSTKK